MHNMNAYCYWLSFLISFLEGGQPVLLLHLADIVMAISQGILVVLSAQIYSYSPQSYLSIPSSVRTSSGRTHARGRPAGGHAPPCTVPGLRLGTTGGRTAGILLSLSRSLQQSGSCLWHSGSCRGIISASRPYFFVDSLVINIICCKAIIHAHAHGQDDRQYDKQQAERMKQQLLTKYSNVKQKTFCQKLLRKKIPYSQLQDRTIVANIPDPQIGNNHISTSKYHLISFPIFNLIEQFTKPSNIYFLLIGILQMIPAISVSEGKPTMFFPLVIVVIVSMVKDFFEDWKRRMSDKKENQSEIQLITQLGFTKIKWENIMVGNIIKVNKDQYFPCDVLLLKHGQESKLAYVETKNLDGETNLKLKKVPHALNFLQKLPDTEMVNTNFQLMFEKPNPFINAFNGNIKINGKKHPLEPSNVILRGCSLKINSFAIGLCIYNGHETKIMMNASHSSPKKSTLELGLNTYFRFICIFQVSITLLFSLIYGAIVSTNYSNLGYTAESPNFFTDAVSAWGSWFISISNFIPISLLVTVEMIRYGQGFFLNKDPKCCTKGFFAQVQTSSVNEQLGQIEYILSDKTGTLTQNLMEFKCICIGNTSYGNPLLSDREEPEKSLITDNETSLNVQTIRSIEQKTLKQLKSIHLEKHVDFDPQQKQRLLYNLHEQMDQKGAQQSQIHNILLHLSLCHNVIKQNQGYSSSSPDELALVSFAKYMGYTFVEKDDDNMMVIEIGGKIIKFRLLHTLQFSSERKRMSVIVEDAKGRLLLLCKGADDIILQRSECTEQEEGELNEHLCTYALQGLRTLVLAQKYLEPEAYHKWNARYEEAVTIVGPDRMEKVYQLQSEVQRGLRILGATAIQDKLQNQVKQTIEDLKKSSIKVWMLTGDKKETAVSIGYSCGLIDENSQKITLDCEPEHAEYLINNVESMLHLIKGDKVTIVSGEILRKIKDETLLKLSNLLKMSSSVICCRVSPKDKETLTKMVREWGRTLAVGDGANDVNMINAANVGVGVKGIEGSQATRAADYVISQFKILKRLVLYYGINFYYRNSNVTLFNLYKNILVTFPLLAYGPLSILSSTYIYETWIFQFFNLFFSSLPIILFGLFNVKFHQKQLQKNPKIYQAGQKSRFFNKFALLKVVLATCMFGLLFVYTTYFGNELALLGEGLMSFQIWSGMLVFNVVVLSVNIRIYMISNQISPALVLASVLSVSSYYLIFFFVEIILYSDCKNVLNHQLSSGIFWLLLLTEVFAIEAFEWCWSKIASHQLRESTRAIGIELTEESASEVNKKKSQEHKVVDGGGSPKKMKKDLSGNQNSGGYAFAEDQQRSVQIL